MLVENTLFGVVDKVASAIKWLREFEPEEGYYLAFSGGKDSQTIYHLAVEAGVKFDAHYSVTGIDPPELVRFIKKNYPNVQRHSPPITMWKLIPKKLMPPTRLVRYCCEVLKEQGGNGRTVITGVRWAESSRRKNSRGLIEVGIKKKRRIFLNNDNDEARKLIDSCPQKSKHMLNPIVDWEDEDVWEYLNSRGIEHCCLYDEGFTRLGCIGCPMSTGKGQHRDFERWPKYRAKYIEAFGKMIEAREAKGINNPPTKFTDPEAVMRWWMQLEPKAVDENQLTMQFYVTECEDGIEEGTYNNGEDH